MGKIVAIGGGELRKGQTFSIDREIVALTGRRRPRALLIPTASGDAEGYAETFERVYGRKLGCKCDVLYLLAAPPSRRAIRETIARADLVYVGGGNTLKMMRRWKFLGVARALRQAHRRGAVLSGVSAGAICWFDNGHSDSMRGYGHKRWSYIRASGLGLVAGTVCPHFHHKDRRREFRKMIRRLGGVGVALDDGCALEVVDGRFRILTSMRGAGAWTLHRSDRRLTERRIPRKLAYRPLPELYVR